MPDLDNFINGNKDAIAAFINMRNTGTEDIWKFMIGLELTTALGEQWPLQCPVPIIAKKRFLIGNLKLIYNDWTII